MGLLDIQGTQPKALGGLLGAGAQAGAGGLPPMPPQLLQAIEQMKGAPPAQRQQFIDHVMQTIGKMGHDENMQRQIMQEFMQAMGQQG